MNFWDLMMIRKQTVDARIRLKDLVDADIISQDDYLDTCARFSSTWVAVRDYMLEQGY